MRITLIHNPSAGSRNADGDKLLKLLEEEGHEVRVQSADDDRWDKALSWPADWVAVAGGDGTVARVAKAMVGRGIPLAPLPAGTANNIGRSLGLVDRPWEELIRGWPGARRVKLDLGTATGPWGKRYFVEGVGAGLFACMLCAGSKRSEQAQAAGGAGRRALHSSRRAQTARAREDAPRRQDISGRYLLVEGSTSLMSDPTFSSRPTASPATEPWMWCSSPRPSATG